jgi:dolichol-phosphate mannosyltransferase
MNMMALQVSVVIPALNEAGNIGRLIDETYLCVPADMLGEVIVVDDASTDTTPDEIKSRVADGNHPELRYLRHAARLGQSAALHSAVRASRFPVVASMDGDGQNDPRDIPKLLALLGEPGGSGPALAGGVRAQRKAEGSKRFASKAANWLRDAILKDDCPDTGCGIKLYWREAFMRLPYFSTMHRYLPALFITYGYGVTFAPVNDRLRQSGVSKYDNLGRALIGVYDLIGVSWLRKRTRVPTIVEDSDHQASSSVKRPAAGGLPQSPARKVI